MNSEDSILAKATSSTTNLYSVAIGETRTQMLRIDSLGTNGCLPLLEAATLRQELRRLREKIENEINASADVSSIAKLESLFCAAETGTDSPLLSDSIGEIRDAVSVAKRAGPRSRTAPLLSAALLLAFAYGFLFAIAWTESTLKIPILEKDSAFLPLVKGVLLLFQASVIVCVTGFCYFIVQVFLPSSDRWNIGAWAEKTKAFWSATGSSDKASQPLTALLSLKALAAMAAASGIVVTAAEVHHQQLPLRSPPPVTEAPDSSKFAAFSSEVDLLKNENSQLEANNRTLSAHLGKMEPLADKLAGIGSPTVHVAMPDKITFAWESQAQASRQEKLEANISDIRKEVGQLGDAIGGAKEGVFRLNQLTAELAKQNQLRDHNLWRLCTAGHKLADALPSLRNGLVGFGADTGPHWKELEFDCNTVISVPGSSTNPN